VAVSIGAQLDRFRGGFPRGALTARRLAGLLDAPGCARREIVDAAGIPLEPLADLLGCPPGRQSPFAHARNGRFESRCTAGTPAPLSELATRLLDLPAPARLRQHDLSNAADPTTRTADLLVPLLTAPSGAEVVVLRGAALGLPVAGELARIDLDTLILAGGAGGTGPVWHPVAIRSFPAVDGIADPARVAQVARVLAVAVLAVRRLAERLDRPPELVSTRALLVLPENFSLRPTGALLDLSPQVRRLSRTLATFADPARVSTPLTTAPPLPTPPTAPTDHGGPDGGRVSAEAEAARRAVGSLPSRFGDGCPGCGLFAFCRDEQDSQDRVARLGTTAANLCGGDATVADVLALAHGARTPTGPAEESLATTLARATRALDLVR
jgi:hypothetical protein